MSRILAFILALSWANQALALSCVRPDAVRYYIDARDAGEMYEVVEGHFQRKRIIMPPRGNDGRSFEWNTRFVGRMLGPDGFMTSYEEDVTVFGGCIASWCVEGPPQGHVLAFIELRGNERILRTNACSSWVVPNPSPADLGRVERCHRGGGCSPE